MEERQISKAVIKRLPRYYRYLGEILDSGMERISSGELMAKADLSITKWDHLVMKMTKNGRSHPYILSILYYHILW